MSYIQDKDNMNKEAETHKKSVWMSIKITFCAIAAMLLLFCVTLVISLITGDSSKKDTEAPTVVGPSGNVFAGYVGDKPIYKSMISVSDNVDQRPTVTVDNSNVNPNKVGNYKVHYTVTDAAGNVTNYTLTYVVKKAEYSYTQLMELIADKAEELGITKSMTKEQQVRKIYEYVNSKNTIEFTDESNIPDINRDAWESDWTEEAVRALDTNEGDCYSYYSLSKAFFEYFGIENIGIRRAENYSGADDDGTHFWSVVKVEDGWYYYDATRLNGTFSSDGTNNACLITQKKINSYRASDAEDHDCEDYFYRMTKPAGFPQISTKELD